MRKKNAAVALVLSLALCFGSVGSVFANTFEIGDQKIPEQDAEKVVMTWVKDLQNGKYKAVDTEGLKEMKKNNKNLVIVDTMPAWSFDSVAAAAAGKAANGHVPGAINAVTGSGVGDAAYKWQDGQKEALLKKVAEAVPQKTTWKKVTKVAYNKLPKAERRTKKVNGKVVYQKKVTSPDKNAPVVVYCGFVGCARSHIGAELLVQNGYKNVYRYMGGIYAWAQAGNEVEGLAK